MTNDKTVTMSRDLAERLDSPHSSVRNAALESLRRIISAPVVERQEWGGPFGVGYGAADPLYPRCTILEDCNVGASGSTQCNTSQPAPVAVALPIDIKQRLNDVWLFLDGQAELNGCVFGEKPEGRHQFWWRKELRSVVEDLNACLDKVKELNQ